MASKPTGREPCQRPKITILASSEADQLLVGRAATMGSKKPAVKTILDCLRGRDQSSNGAIATAALLFGTRESGLSAHAGGRCRLEAGPLLGAALSVPSVQLQGDNPPAGLAKWASADRQ